MKRVGISEFKSHLSEHLRAAEAGEVIEVLDRARPIAKVVPMDRDTAGLELIPATRNFASVRSVSLASAKLSRSSLELLRADRGSR
jgi:prevent-host-death family protein